MSHEIDIGEVPSTSPNGNNESSTNLIQRAIGKTADAMNAIGSVLIGVLTIIICTDVASRGLFNKPISGVPELAAMFIVAIVYLQIASSLKAGRWATADLLLDKLKPNARRPLEALYSLCGAALFTLISFAVIPLVTDSYESGDYMGVPGMFTFPTWPIKSLVVFGSAICVLQFVLLAVEKIKTNGDEA